MYDPVKDGLKKQSGAVCYRESKPPLQLSKVVHSYWQIRTEAPLNTEFTLHAIPDACTNILLNQKNTEIAGVTALKTTYTELNLGKDFDYAGIQFFPGVWKGNSNETSDSFVGSRYMGELPLIEANIKSAQLDFSDKQPIFTDLVLNLIDLKVVQKNMVIFKILSNLERIHSVSEMAAVTHLSARQLQRKLKQATGFTPHDFFKGDSLTGFIKAA